MEDKDLFNYFSNDNEKNKISPQLDYDSGKYYNKDIVDTQTNIQKAKQEKAAMTQSKLDDLQKEIHELEKQVYVNNVELKAHTSEQVHAIENKFEKAIGEFKESHAQLIGHINTSGERQRADNEGLRADFKGLISSNAEFKTEVIKSLNDTKIELTQGLSGLKSELSSGLFKVESKVHSEISGVHKLLITMVLTLAVGMGTMMYRANSNQNEMMLRNNSDKSELQQQLFSLNKNLSLIQSQIQTDRTIGSQLNELESRMKSIEPVAHRPGPNQKTLDQEQGKH